MRDPRYPTAITPSGPEWDTVEQERDYWKRLALAYGAKLSAVQTAVSYGADIPAIADALAKSWTVELDELGQHWITEDKTTADRTD